MRRKRFARHHATTMPPKESSPRSRHYDAIYDADDATAGRDEWPMPQIGHNTLRWLAMSALIMLARATFYDAFDKIRRALSDAGASAWVDRNTRLLMTYARE